MDSAAETSPRGSSVTQLGHMASDSGSEHSDLGFASLLNNKYLHKGVKITVNEDKN